MLIRDKSFVSLRLNSVSAFYPVLLYLKQKSGRRGMPEPTYIGTLTTAPPSGSLTSKYKCRLEGKSVSILNTVPSAKSCRAKIISFTCPFGCVTAALLEMGASVYRRK